MINKTSENNKRIAKNSIFMTIRMIVVMFLTFYTTRVVLSRLGVVDFGVYNVVCGFVAMFAFMNTSMSNGIQRFFNFEYAKNGEGGANKVFITAVQIQVILAIILVCIVEIAGYWYLNNKMVIPDDRFIAANWIFQFSILNFVFVILEAPFAAAITAHERMDFYALVGVLDAILKLFIAFSLDNILGDNLIIYGLLLALISVLDFLLYFIYSKYHFKEIRFSWCFDKDLFKSMLVFSGWNFFGAFSGVMKEQGINLVINLFFGPIVNAARGVATQINSGLQSFVANVTTPVRPQVIQSYAQGNITRILNLTFSISKLSCVCQYMMALPLIYEVDFVLGIWLEGEIPEHTSSFIIIIIATSFLNNLNSAVSAVIHASGKMKKYQVLTSITAMMCIPLAYVVLIRGASPEWALIMVTLTMLFAQIVSVLILGTVIELSFLTYLTKIIWPLAMIIIATIWIPLIITSIMVEGWWRLIVNIIISVIAICFFYYHLALEQNEKELIDNILLSKLKMKNHKSQN